MSIVPGQTFAAWDVIFEYSRSNRFRVVVAATLIMFAITLVDLGAAHSVPWGFLYIIPLVVSAGFLKRWQIVALAVSAAILTEAGRNSAWSGDYVPRIAAIAIAFAGAALFVQELARNRQLALDHVKELNERQQLERQLRHARRLEAVGQLAGGVAHDFNNLLSVIIGYSELALRQTEASASLRRDIEQIHQAADRAARLTRQLLEFSRHDILQPKVLDLNALLTNLTNMLGRVIGENIDLRLSLQPQLGRVKVDPGSIEQVIMNLVVNARDAMPRGGKLSIETADLEIAGPSPTAPPGIPSGLYVKLAVRDTGMGMDRNVQEHLFEPFFTTKEVGKGTGLGLATVYGIVKQNGGDIWFESEPGRGTTFSIYLPRTEEAMDQAGRAAQLRAPSRGPATVLLVEDDDSVRDLTREILASNGFTVIAARNPMEAIEISKRPSVHFDLLLTDVVMPGMSGPELVETLSQDMPGLNVLFMTGYADRSVLPDTLQASAALIQKPLAADTLLASIRSVLARRVGQVSDLPS